MAKRIFMSKSEIESIVNELRQQLASMKTFGTLEFKKEVGAKDEKKATIYFTQIAWIKMIALVQKFDTEVQWHACVKRTGDTEFTVNDILVFPHEVTGSTVTSDQEKYTEWLNNLPDEVFNDLKFHGHSHVNMAVSPSATDNQYREDIVTQLPIPPEGSDEDSFYIFMIINKRGEWSAQIYDLKNNDLFDTAQISIEVFTDDGLLGDFIAEAKKLATTRVYTTPTVPANKESPWDRAGKPGTVYGNKQGGTKKKQKEEVPPSTQFDEDDFYGYGKYSQYYQDHWYGY